MSSWSRASPSKLLPCASALKEHAKIEADRRKAELKRVEDERRSKAAEEAGKRAMAEEEKRQREDAQRKKKAEEEARRKDMEKQTRVSCMTGPVTLTSVKTDALPHFQEKERADMHAKIAAQKQEYMDRQAAAMKNKAAVEQQIRGPSVALPAGPRKQWQPVEVLDAGKVGDSKWTGVEQRAPPRGVVELTPEQRRAAWEEMQAAAKRNRQQAGAEAGGGGGLAAFLGVPEGNNGDRDEGRVPARPSSEERYGLETLTLPC